MQPGAYNIALTENATNVLSFDISDITTMTGYSAAMDFRQGDRPIDTIVLALTSSPAAGLALSIVGGILRVTMTITEAQVDPIAATLATTTVSYSLKITAPAGTTTQYLRGNVTITRTPTA